MLIRTLFLLMSALAFASPEPYEYLQSDYFLSNDSRPFDVTAVLGHRNLVMIAGKCFGKGVPKAQPGLLTLFKPAGEEAKIYFSGSKDEQTGKELPDDFYSTKSISLLAHWTLNLSGLSTGRIYSGSFVSDDLKNGVSYRVRTYPSNDYPYFGQLVVKRKDSAGKWNDDFVGAICYFSHLLPEKLASESNYYPTRAAAMGGYRAPMSGSSLYFQYGYYSGDRFIPTAVPVYSNSPPRPAPSGVLRGQYGYWSGNKFIPTAVPVYQSAP